MNKNTKYIMRSITACAIMATIVTACSKGKYAVIETPDGVELQHPGSFTINVDNSGTSGSSTSTAIIVASADGKKTYSVKPGTATDVEAGLYYILSYRTSTETALPSSVNLSQSGLVTLTADANGMLPLLPAIEGAVETMTVVDGSAITKDIYLKPLTRLLDVKGTLNGANVASIKSITVTLSGVSATAQITSRASEDTSYKVAMDVTPASNGTFEAPFNLLGINPRLHQMLNINVLFNDNTSYNYQQDVSAMLTGFNEGSYSQAVGLSAVINFGLNNITGTISPWTPGWDQGGTGE